MCGIAGFIDFKRESTKENLVQMCEALSHRGPDGHGNILYQKDRYQVGLGHRRLSIIDLSTAAGQPMFYKNFAIVFNGEIYNYNEIRNELIDKQHQFNTHSDTEVMLHAFEEWGIAAVNRFIGMFAFVLYDEQNEKLYCVRDRVGVKPLSYYWHNDLFIFGSELKAFTRHNRFEKKVNTSSVGSFLQYAYIPAPNSIYEHTYKLRPGHYLEFDLRSHSYSTRQYWNVYDYYNKPKLNIPLEEAINETEKILTKAFQYRMVADVPVGVFLSGGYDSSCVTALLQKDRTEKLKTFTIGVEDPKLDEAPFAKEIAKYLGTEHVEYHCTWKEALDIIPELPYYYDEPFADSSAIPTVLVSKLARKAVTVALSADAGDEVFSGYRRYYTMSNVSRTLSHIPRLIRNSGSAFMELFDPYAFPLLGKKYSFTNRYQKFSKLLKNPQIGEVLKSGMHQFYGQDIEKLLAVPVREQATAFDSTELQRDYFEEELYLMSMDFQTFLPDDILQKVDRATMSVSLEGREPFLDQHILQWAAQLPTNFKLNDGISKYILREIVHRHIPKQMMDRPKMGFCIPISSWLENELKHLLVRYFDKRFIQQQGIFNAAEMQRILGRFLNGRQERSEKIWCILMFQMWYEKWMS